MPTTRGSVFIRPAAIRRFRGTLAGILGIADLEDGATLVPGELVYDRRGEHSESRYRRLLREGGARGRAQLLTTGPLGRAMAHTDYDLRRHGELYMRRAMFGRQPTKGGREREWIAAGGASPGASSPASSPTGGTPANPLGPCLGCR